MEPPVRAPFALEITVAPEDIDEQRHVSNVRVLDWMNRAAIAHSAALGFDFPRYQEVGGIFVVRRHEIDYLLPAYLGERLVLYTWPSARKRAIAERRHELRRRDDGAVLARGLNVWVFVDLERGKPRPMPPEVVEAFDPARFL